jgi:hypothetical protein
MRAHVAGSGVMMMVFRPAPQKKASGLGWRRK